MIEDDTDINPEYSRDEFAKKSTDDCRNGYTTKTVRSELGHVQLDVPRDRKDEFEVKSCLSISVMSQGNHTKHVIEELKTGLSCRRYNIGLKWKHNYI